MAYHTAFVLRGTAIVARDPNWVPLRQDPAAKPAEGGLPIVVQVTGRDWFSQPVQYQEVRAVPVVVAAGRGWLTADAVTHMAQPLAPDLLSPAQKVVVRQALITRAPQAWIAAPGAFRRLFRPCDLGPLTGAEVRAILQTWDSAPGGWRAEVRAAAPTAAYYGAADEVSGAALHIERACPQCHGPVLSACGQSGADPDGPEAICANGHHLHGGPDGNWRLE